MRRGRGNRRRRGSVRPPEFRGQIRTRRAQHWLAGLPRPLVFTNGVFDLLHRGHVTYLARARALGAALLVALNGDASARRLGKGEGPAAQSLEDRLALVAALERGRRGHLVRRGHAGALIKSCARRCWSRAATGRRSDRRRQRVLARGGKVVSIPFEHQRSTTALMRRIRGGA